MIQCTYIQITWRDELYHLGQFTVGETYPVIKHNPNIANFDRMVLVEDDLGQTYSLDLKYPFSYGYDWIVTFEDVEENKTMNEKNSWYYRCELPPVGEKVIFVPDLERYSWDSSYSVPKEGTEVEVIAHRTTSHGNDVAVVFWDDEGAACAGGFVAGNFEPLPDPLNEAILGVASFGLSYTSAQEIVEGILNGTVPNEIFKQIK